VERRIAGNLRSGCGVARGLFRPEGRAIVLAVCLNGGPDKVYEVPGFALTGIHRPGRTRSCVGGKGINVARVLHRLRCDVRVFGLAAGTGGDYMESELAAEGIRTSLLRVEGESRLATTILDPDRGTHTEVNEAGPLVGTDDADRVLREFEEQLAGVDWCAIGGSAPPGFPEDIYARMVALCKERGVPVLLDTNRQWLLGSYASGADVLKPNQTELATIAGREVTDERSAVEAAREVLGHGTRLVLVTLGERGALAVSPEAALRASLAYEIHPISAVGSGDAFLAGYLAGWIRELPLEERLRLAVAAGAANVEVFGPGFVEPARVESLTRHVLVESCA
jgi:tagatose 6-phosphate kinase